MSETLKGAACAVAAVVLGLAGSAASLAQQSAVDRCREADSDQARIACLERALGAEPSMAAPPADPVPVPDPAARPPAEAERRAEPRPGPESVDPPSPAEEQAVPQAGPQVGPTGIGAEQVRARTESAAEREARLASAADLRVAAYREVPYQRLQVELENGQVWRQIKGDTQYIRVDLDRNQTVDIEESTLGGYKLHLNEMRRTIRVERVR